MSRRVQAPGFLPITLPSGVMHSRVQLTSEANAFPTGLQLSLSLYEQFLNWLAHLYVELLCPGRHMDISPPDMTDQKPNALPSWGPTCPSQFPQGSDM